MKFIKKSSFIISILLILLANNKLFSQGAACNTAEPFCTGTPATFPAGVNSGAAPFGNNYGCLGSQPNAAWYYLQISTGGNLTISINGSPPVDLDFALWGPFPDLPTAMGNCGSLGPPYDCSYAGGTAPEIVNITAAIPGQVYILLITNYSNTPTNVTFVNTAGSATTNCSILLPCLITSLTTNPTACNSLSNTYGVSGSVVFTDPPTTGTLTFTDCHGNNQVFNAPFTSPINYNITGITANGAPCNVTAAFSSTPACTFTTNYSSPVSCLVPCVMDSMPVAMTNCYNSPFLQYDVAGTIYFTDPPTTGTLTITPCSGPAQVFNAPFGTSQAFTFIGLPQTGTNCAFTAVFSADPACTITTNFMSPPPITGFTLSSGNCVNGVYYLNGTVSFSSPPGAGTLTVSYNDGISTVDTVINAPFSSPENWSITAPANGNNYTITVFFSGFPSCTMVSTGTSPASCGCVADIGTFTTTIAPNNGQTPYQLCFGDQFTMTSNGDFVPPDDILSGPYNPDIGYLIYSCPPTIAVTPSNTFPNDWIGNDPCFIGIVGFGNNFNDINSSGGPSFAGPWTNNTIYFVPITFYDTTGLLYSNVFAGNLPCYEMGPPFAVQYLTEITSVSVPNCLDSSVTVTISGGLPEANGSLYTASNLLPLGASFVNTTAPHGGNIVINGLQNGDMYSFDVVDTNGCPITITGGPFVGLPNANANVNDTSCTLSYNLNAIPSFGTGAWSGGTGVVFAPANSPTATVTVPAAGTYTLTWTETNTPGCSSSDNVDITFSILSISNILINPTCNGTNDGSITVSPLGGALPYSYSWSSSTGTAPLETGLGAVPVTVTVTDAFGCFLDSTFILSEPAAFSYTTASQNSNCGSPDGWAAVVNFSGGTNAPYTYNWNGAGPATNDTLFGIVSGVNTVTVADPSGCDTTFSIQVESSLNPIADFTMNPNPTTIFDPTINFFDQSTAFSPPMMNWFWDIGGLDTSILQNPSYIFPEDTGNYLITLIVTDSKGCKDTVTKIAIITGEYGIYVPNAFTPDGDNINDGFFPNGFGISDKDYTFFIFDRWGEIIFESHSKFDPWNGTYKGKIVPNDVFVWKLIFTDINGKSHTKLGHITIIK